MQTWTCFLCLIFPLRSISSDAGLFPCVLSLYINSALQKGVCRPVGKMNLFISRSLQDLKRIFKSMWMQEQLKTHIRTVCSATRDKETETWFCKAYSTLRNTCVKIIIKLQKILLVCYIDKLHTSYKESIVYAEVESWSSKCILLTVMFFNISFTSYPFIFSSDVNRYVLLFICCISPCYQDILESTAEHFAFTKNCRINLSE